MATVHPVLMPDIQASDLWAALAYCALPASRDVAIRRLHAQWGDPAHTLATTTLRSGLDLYLQALSLPPGSEVLMSAVTHPDMVEVVRSLGLVPVPIDLDPATMAPQVALVRRALTPNTRVLVVAQLFGGHFDLDALLALCAEHDVRFVEDCAQTFGGGYAGHPAADISLFSFGPLKTRTALAGALSTVRDAEVCRRMAAIQATYPVMGRLSFFLRVLKYGALCWLSSDTKRWGRVCRLIEMRGKDPSVEVRKWTRSLTGAFNIARFRVQPALPLVRLLTRRLRQGDVAAWVPRRRAAGVALSSLLGGVERPGAAADNHLHWLFPVMVRDRQATLDRLYAGGFQAMTGLSNLDTFDPPAARPDLVPTEARRILAGALVIPMHPALQEVDVAALAALLGMEAVPAAKPEVSRV